MESTTDAGQLYVVAVPIGNLEDITLRALRILEEVDLILCEDTRTTGKLLELLGLPKRPMLSLHDHNESARTDKVLEKLKSGRTLALVSDAGTPVISDPGERLIATLVQSDIRISPVPGPCALITALCGAGLSGGTFTFLGFPPTKAGPLSRHLETHAKSPHTLVFYVGPHHLKKFLDQAATCFGRERRVVVGRELTKKFEEFIRGELGEVVERLQTVRGEVVVLIEGQLEREAPSEEQIVMELELLLAQGLKPTAAAKSVAKSLGCTREEVYKIGLRLKAGTH